jgi:alanine racemase
MTGLAVATRTERASGPLLEVDLSAVAANTELLAARTTGRLMAVVKADAFGHGAVEVARTALAHGATWLGVTGLDEAWPLRDAGLEAPVLSWLNPVDADVTTAVERRVDLAVPSLEHLAATVAAPGRARVHLHLDAGMARDGASPAEWPRLCRAARLAETRGEVEVVGVMGHLGCADDPADPCNARARTRFAWALEVARSCGLRPSERHLAATAATLTDPRSHHTMSRVGAGLVGIDPSRTTALRSPLTLGLVPLGYADGLPRSASHHAEVQHRGRRAPVVGRISMDQVVVDLGESGGEVGDRVAVFGPGDDGEPTVADWARWSDTIEHEIVTGIGPRVPRHTRAAARLRSVR